MTTKRTLSEIRATCTKAARGAGCPWGLAEEAGMAARVLQSHGLAASQALAELFKTPRACACDGSGQTKCGIALSAEISDMLIEQTIEGPIAAPILLLAPLLQSADGPWELDWETGSAVCSDEGITLRGNPPPEIAPRVVLKKATASTTSQASSWKSQPVDEDAWNTLISFAAKTYVPETDQSRAAGAGPADSQDD